jgi:hypothetical protein
MTTDKKDQIYKAKSEEIIGCAIEIHNRLGSGFSYYDLPKTEPPFSGYIINFKH